MSKARPHFDPLSDSAVALRTLLRDVDWRSAFTRNALDKAGQLHRQGMASIERLLVAADGHSYELLGRVESQSAWNKRYRVLVRFLHKARGFTLSGECACPMFYQCKHAAALVLQLLDDSDFDVPETVSGPEAEARLALQRQLMAQAAAQGMDIAELFPGVKPPAPSPADARLERSLREWKDWLQRLRLPPPAVAQPVPLRYDLAVHNQQLQVRVLADRARTRRYEVIGSEWQGSAGDPWEMVPESEQQTLQAVLAQRRSDMHSQTRVLMGAQGERVLAAILARDCRLDGQPLRAGAERRACLRWRAQPGGSQKLVAGSDGDAQIVIIGGLWYVDAKTAEVGPLSGLSAAEFERVRRAPTLPAETRAALLTDASNWPVDLPLPPEIGLRALRSLDGARLQLERRNAGAAPSQSDRYSATLYYRYADCQVGYDDHRDPVEIVEEGRQTTIHRDRRLELGSVQKLAALGVNPQPEFFPQNRTLWGPGSYGVRGEDWLLLAAPLREAGFDLDFGADFPLRLEAAPDEWYADLDDAPGNAWFDLELGIRIGEERVSLLPILVRALASRTLSLTPQPGEAADAKWLAPIDAQRRVPLPLQRVRELVAPIVEWLERVDAGRLRLPALRADLADAYAGMDFEVRAADQLRKLAAALGSPLAQQPVPPPAALRAQLRDYQSAGLTWLDFLGRHGLGGVLADDMGLGKTVQILAHVLSERDQGRLRGPVLVVMPTSLLPNWQAETTRFAPDLRVLALHGSDRAERYSLAAQHDLVLTSYALLARDIEALAGIAFDLVVFDEAQALKNPASKGALCARKLQAGRRLLVTGTPLENHLGELWAGVDLVLPGLLGERRAFTSHYRTPIEKRGDREVLARLNRRMKPFLLRRTKQQVAAELPPKTEIVQRVEIEGAQRELYESLRLAMHERVRQAIRARGVAQSSIVVLDALLKLRQACCDPQLVKLATARRVKSSAKRAALLDLLQPLLEEGRRVLLFSQFTEMLDLIQHDLDAQSIPWVRLDGSTRDRAAPVQTFQAGHVPLMLISLKAGGVGLNLTAADTVIHYDPWWNPAVEQQASDRAHRIGQDKPVFVYKLVCVDTVEDKIVALQARKAELAASILDGGSSTTLSLDEATIEELLGPG